MEQFFLNSANTSTLVITKSEMSQQLYNEFLNLPFGSVNRKGTSDEFISFRTFQYQQQENKVFEVLQFDEHFSYQSRVSFGVFTSFDDAVEQMKQGFEKLYPGFCESLYKNSHNQWLAESNTFNFGVMIQEIELNKFEEI